MAGQVLESGFELLSFGQVEVVGQQMVDVSLGVVDGNGADGGVALLMDGGTASVYGPRAWQAYTELLVA